MLAISMGEGKVYLGWRLLGSDPEDVAFTVYRSTAGRALVKLNAQPLTRTTDFVDEEAPLDQANAWFVKPMVNNQEKAVSERAALVANRPIQQYKTIPIRTSDYAATREKMHLSGQTGFLLDAPEYLAVHNGETGELIDKVDWIELGKVQDWGDNTGNRASRHMMASEDSSGWRH